MHLDAALAEARAAAPTGVVVLDTLALYHPSFINEAGQASPLFLVNNNEAVMATLEASAPQFANQTVECLPIGFKPTRPEMSAGSVPIFSITIDNVGDEFAEQIERSQSAVPRQPILCTHREYLSTQLNAPSYISPYLQALTDITITPSRITAKARVTDSANINFLRSVYTLTQFPGLIR
jgi:hypothetical protein